MSGQYWFPNMPIPEIMTALSEWGLSVSNEQLARPSSDFVTGVYTACLEQVTNITPDVLHDPVHNALAALDDPNTVRPFSSSSPRLTPPRISTSPASHTTFSSTTSPASQTQPASWTLAQRISTSPNQNAPASSSPLSSTLSSLLNNAPPLSPTFATGPPPSSRSASTSPRTSLPSNTNSTRSSKHRPRHILSSLEQRPRAQRARDEPKCDQLRAENAAITAHLMATKETTQSVVKDIEALKVEKANVILKKENINSDTSLLLDNIQRTRGRIVQSPERIKRNISSMGATAIEDKKSLVMHEAKARDLQAKIAVLTNIEKVPSPLLVSLFHSP